MNFFDECASTKRETWLDHPGYLKIGDETVKLKCSPIEGKQQQEEYQENNSLENEEREGIMLLARTEGQL